ncbi:MAG TPA: hypothetical protein VKY31_06820, partial [Terriglobia bacterium]|nr:hypothetical protein [Terriglobia bacterium]
LDQTGIVVGIGCELNGFSREGDTFSGYQVPRLSRDVPRASNLAPDIREYFVQPLCRHFRFGSGQ